MNWFKPRTNPVPVTPLAPAPYHERMENSRDTLHWSVKKNSNALSAKAYSEVRELERVLKEINGFLVEHTATAADEHMLDSIMKDYLPSAMELFMKLPAPERVDGGEGDQLLLKQCRTMARDLRDRLTEMHERAKKDLQVQAEFIENRFSEANLA